MLLGQCNDVRRIADPPGFHLAPAFLSALIYNRTTVWARPFPAPNCDISSCCCQSLRFCLQRVWEVKCRLTYTKVTELDPALCVYIDAPACSRFLGILLQANSNKRHLPFFAA